MRARKRPSRVATAGFDLSLDILNAGRTFFESDQCPTDPAIAAANLHRADHALQMFSGGIAWSR